MSLIFSHDSGSTGGSCSNDLLGLADQREALL
jgi:hypothetical protein